MRRGNNDLDMSYCAPLAWWNKVSHNRAYMKQGITNFIESFYFLLE